MTPPLAHVLGMPLEETAAALVPFGLALLAALRVSVRRIGTRRKRGAATRPGA
jgi:hypothetical protein